MKKRNVLLIVDNCCSLFAMEGLKSITLHFFPPNATCPSQLMDQGIIKRSETSLQVQPVVKGLGIHGC